MLLFALSALAASLQPAPRPGAAAEQVTASVRIVSGVEIHANSRPADAMVRTVTLHDADSGQTPVRLIEFP